MSSVHCGSSSSEEGAWARCFERRADERGETGSRAKTTDLLVGEGVRGEVIRAVVGFSAVSLYQTLIYRKVREKDDAMQ